MENDIKKDIEAMESIKHLVGLTIAATAIRLLADGRTDEAGELADILMQGATQAFETARQPILEACERCETLVQEWERDDPDAVEHHRALRDQISVTRDAIGAGVESMRELGWPEKNSPP